MASQDISKLMGEALNQIAPTMEKVTLKESEPLSKCLDCGVEVEPPRYKTNVREKILLKEDGHPGLNQFQSFKKGDILDSFSFDHIQRQAQARAIPLPAYERTRVECRQNEYLVNRGSVRCADCAYKALIIEKDRSAKMTISIPFKFESENFPLESGFRKFIPTWEHGRGLFLHGSAGTGKSTTIIGIMREWFAQQSDFSSPYGPEHFRSNWKFVNYPSWIISVQGSYRRNGKEDETAEEMIQSLTDVPFLIIDDIGAEKMTDFVRQTTYAIINEREMEMRPTFITSNFSLQQLNEHIDSRVASRIAGMCDVIELKGRDRRIKQQIIS